MIERDYIMRILQEFFNAIAKVVHQKDESGDFDEAEERYDEMYRQFFHSKRKYFLDTEKETIVAELEDACNDERDLTGKLQMLAELLYQDALIRQSIQEQIDLLEKALYILQYLKANSNTYLWEQSQRMADIKRFIEEYDAVSDAK
jgi:nucleoside diphosphate kinase